MAIQIVDSVGGNNIVAVDDDGNVQTVYGLPSISGTFYGISGSYYGYYSVTGNSITSASASIPASITFAAMRVKAASTRKIYVTSINVRIGASTQGASAAVAGSLGIQRFTGADPAGGTSRTPNELDESLSVLTDVTIVVDNSGSLTTGSMVFGNVVSNALVPNFVGPSGSMHYDWEYKPNFPTVLAAGDGLCLRTQTAMPATQTWSYSYTICWFEK